MDTLLDPLNEAQREAVTAPPAPLLVLAGAGSGKTRVLTHRIAFLMREHGSPPSSIVGVTFTNKAAEEMRSRLAGLAGPAGLALRLSTFHALGARLLRAHGGAVGLPPAFTILDDDDTLVLCREALRAEGLEGSLQPAALAAEIGRAKALGVPAAEARERAEDDRAQDLARAYARYEAVRERAGGADFDDLILLPTRLLAAREDIRERLHREIAHVLVDEYQDTSPAQYRFLRALVGPARSLTVVGDPDQAIYRWRGADIRNILEFERDFPDARAVVLELNYRSTGNILAAASALIARNAARKPKVLRTEGPDGAPLASFAAVDETDEARFAGDMIEARLHAGESPGAFAVLYRTHAQSRALEEALTFRRVPYVLVGGVKFYARREVKDALAYLRVLANPADGLSLARALAAPPRGVGETSLARIADAAAASGGTALDALRSPEGQALLPGRARQAARDFLALLNRMAETAAASGWPAALTTALEGSGYLTWLERRDPGEAADRRANLAELLGAAASAAQAGTTLPEYLERAALMAELDRLGAGASAVTLMTLHNAKGLEFRHVVLCGLEEGLLPHASSLADPEELEEERRLLYVGLTRARETILITWARGRRTYDRFQWGAPSRFLGEIPESLLVPVETPRDVPPRPERVEGLRGRRMSFPAPAREPVVHLEEEGMVAFRPGEEVRHEQFGRGRVLTLSGAGPETRVRVLFPRHGHKTFLARAARLERAEAPS